MASGGTVVLIQARQGSNRLPGKSLRPMLGRPMIHHVIERAKAIGFLRVWLVTSLDERDDGLANEADKQGVDVYRGSEWDVLQRMADAARLSRADVVVRLTGDCPLLAPDVSRIVIDKFLDGAGKYRYASNDTDRSGWPDGTDTEVFSADDLYESCMLAAVQDDREHVTRYMRRVLPASEMLMLACEETWKHLKLSVDRMDDFKRVEEIMGYLEGSTPNRLGWLATRAACQRWLKEKVHHS